AADPPWRRELRARMDARREADHLRVEHARSARPRLRYLSDQSRWHGPGADHVQRQLRRVSHVLARRPEAGVRIEPQRQDRRRDERLHRRLGELEPKITTEDTEEEQRHALRN